VAQNPYILPIKGDDDVNTEVLVRLLLG